MKDRKETKVTFSEEGKKKMTYVFWGFGMFPFLIVCALLLFQSEDDLPPVEMLADPPELQASVVFAADGGSAGRRLRDAARDADACGLVVADRDRRHRIYPRC